MILGEYTHGGDIYRNRAEYDFSANVNPLGTPKEVIDAICESAGSLSLYPDPYCTRLREKLGKRLNADSDEIICANGAAELIFQFVQAVKPKRALLPVPSFSEYESALRVSGTEIKYFDLERNNGFKVGDDVLEAITPDIDMLIVCNPNNPTGLPVEKELMLKITERCRENGTWLLVDECFTGLTDEEIAYTLLPYLMEDDRVFLLRAFTKLYGMAGARLGYGVCRNRELLCDMCAIVQPWNVSSMAQAAGIAATDCTEFARTTRAVIRKERAFLESGLESLGISFIPSRANYILFRGDRDTAEKLLKRGILIRSCKNYRGLDECDFRIAVRTHGENEVLLRALAEIKEEKE